MTAVQGYVDKVDLAYFYVEDGAFRSAARALREAAAMLERHAEACALAEQEALPADPINLAGSGPVPIAPRVRR